VALCGETASCRRRIVKSTATHGKPRFVSVDLRVPPLEVLHQRRSEKWHGYDSDVIVSTIAEMDFPLAAPIAAALHAAVDRHDLGYAPERIPRLVDAFVDFAGRRLGWRVDAGQVRLIPDVMVGVLELSRLLAGPEGSIAFATPSYPPFLLEPPPSRLIVREVPLQDDGGLDLDALGGELDAGTRVFVLVNPHNPTGRVLPRTELEQLAELCAEHSAWVIADEIHAPLVLGGATYTPWLEVSDAARACGFALTSASKAFNLAALKTALLVTASDLTRSTADQLPPLTDHAGLLGVIAGEVAFNDCDDWLDAVLETLAGNRELLGRLLAAHLPDIRWTPPEATYMAWLDCRSLNLGDNPAEAFLERGRVALSAGPDYGEVGTGYARLNFGTSPELVAAMVERMATALVDQ
jgi:cysteine-S-conjugate beta-lyase